MQLLKRNKRTIKYKNYLGTMTMQTDTDGNYTGEYTEAYSDFKTAKLYATPDRGYASEEMFGMNLDYDKVIYAEPSVDIDEYSLLWVTAPTTDPNDYIVKKVAESLNHKAIAIKKVR